MKNIRKFGITMDLIDMFFIIMESMLEGLEGILCIWLDCMILLKCLENTHYLHWLNNIKKGLIKFYKFIIKEKLCNITQNLKTKK